VRRNYEYRIATMQAQITSLQRDLGDAMERESKWKDGEAKLATKVMQMEEEIVSMRQVIHSSSAQTMSLTCMIISILTRKVWLCVLSRRNLTNGGKFASKKKSPPPPMLLRLYVVDVTVMNSYLYVY
jgi:hypothetical protein